LLWARRPRKKLAGHQRADVGTPWPLVRLQTCGQRRFVARIAFWPSLIIPRFLLRDPRQKGEAWKDLQMVMKYLGIEPPKRKPPTEECHSEQREEPWVCPAPIGVAASGKYPDPSLPLGMTVRGNGGSDVGYPSNQCPNSAT